MAFLKISAMKLNVVTKKLPKSSGKMSEDQEEKIFSALILQGRLWEAVRFITDRQGGGAMAPEDDAVKPFGNL